MKPKEVRLNNFILWCKGWYEPVNEKDTVFDCALRALNLDGYICATTNNVNGIVLNFIDDIIDNGIIDSRHGPLRAFNWHKSIIENMHWFNNNYDEALLYTIRNFFAYDISSDEIKLIPPVYSRKLFKMGFVAPKHFGNSYKMQNYKVNEYFNNKINK